MMELDNDHVEHNELADSAVTSIAIKTFNGRLMGNFTMKEP